jgi:hypothetical protein
MNNDALYYATGLLPSLSIPAAAPSDYSGPASHDLSSEHVLHPESELHPVLSYSSSGLRQSPARQLGLSTNCGVVLEKLQLVVNLTVPMNSSGESLTRDKFPSSSCTILSHQLLSAMPQMGGLEDPLDVLATFALRLSLHQLATAAGGSAWLVISPPRPNT